MEPLIPSERFEVFASGVDHPECVAFDRDGNLWAGGEAGQVYRIDPRGTVEQVTTLGSFNGGIAFSPRDHSLIVCCPARGLVRVEPSTGAFEVFATHAGEHKMICPNFPVFDGAGNLLVTDSGDWKKNNGRLLRFTPDGKGTTLAGPFGYANGLAFTTDEKTLFMVESNTDRVLRFDVNADGSVGPLHVYAENVGRLPDGLALDDDGNVYCSCYASDDIHRIPPGGKTVELFAYDRWAILLSRPTNMAFGGGKMDTMYIANLGRTTITRANVGFRGQALANQRN
jgi:gluconolactonase